MDSVSQTVVTVVTQAALNVLVGKGIINANVAPDVKAVEALLPEILAEIQKIEPTVVQTIADIEAELPKAETAFTVLEDDITHGHILQAIANLKADVMESMGFGQKVQAEVQPQIPDATKVVDDIKAAVTPTAPVTADAPKQ